MVQQFFCHISSTEHISNVVEPLILQYLLLVNSTVIKLFAIQLF